MNVSSEQYFWKCIALRITAIERPNLKIRKPFSSEGRPEGRVDRDSVGEAFIRLATCHIRPRDLCERQSPSAMVTMEEGVKEDKPCSTDELLSSDAYVCNQCRTIFSVVFCTLLVNKSQVGKRSTTSCSPYHEKAHFHPPPAVSLL